jgi:urease accessory protein
MCDKKAASRRLIRCKDKLAYFCRAAWCCVVLVAQDGSLIKVLAAPQNVLKITHCPQHGTVFDLIRAAYHLGNRHVPIELNPDHLKIEPDHVLADMLHAMHLMVTKVCEPFEPENGAYSSGGHAHGHAHGHNHSNAEAKHNSPHPSLTPKAGRSHTHDICSQPAATHVAGLTGLAHWWLLLF